MISRLLRSLGLLGAACLACQARAEETKPEPPPPDFTIALRETADVWRNVQGGQSVGWTSLNKLQLSTTWIARRWGDPGLRFHLQLFRTNGERLTSRTGDIQTASNIEALSTDRLFEAWAEQGWGKTGQGGLALRAGLLDLNADFDSIDPASLFIDSSHGIAPDLSKSGRNGPSIFPVSSLGARLQWTPTDDWTVKAAAFDGVPGDPAHPKAFAAVRLSGSDGALLIAEADRKLGKDAQLSFGAWTYTSRIPGVDGASLRRDRGLFGFFEGPLPGLDGWQGWLRAGIADPDAQVVAGYLGAGVVKTEPLPGRKSDRLGLAVSRAIISDTARRAQGLADAETTLEATYQYQVRETIALQPDVQYIIHPSTRPGLADALAVGLRLVVTYGYPRQAKATQSSDPTVPPDAAP